MSKKYRQKTLAKPAPILNTNISSTTDIVQFETELTWCIQQLENPLNNLEKKLSSRQAEEVIKNIKILKSPNAPLVKKRQVMKSALGDYRGKMKEEERKMALLSKQIKFTENIDAGKKHSFVKKSALLSTGKDFRFDFQSSDFDNQQECLDAASADSTKNSYEDVHKKLNLTCGQGFKFNFAVNDTNEEFSLNGLSLSTN